MGKSFHHQLWADVTESLQAFKFEDAQAIADKYCRHALKGSVAATEILNICPGTTLYDAARKLIATRVALAERESQLARCRYVANLREAEFWHEVETTSGIQFQEGLHELEPLSGRVVYTQEQKQTKTARGTDTIQRCMEENKALVEQALNSSLTARQMSSDQRLPEWLRTLADEISTGNLKPHLRQFICDCLSHPENAAAYVGSPEASELPAWLIDFCRSIQQCAATSLDS